MTKAVEEKKNRQDSTTLVSTKVGIEKKKSNRKRRWVAQRRTSAHKKHVFVTSHFVYKGPYDRNSARLQTTLARHLLLGCILNDKTVQKPTLVQWSDGWYLRFPNIASTPFSSWETEETSTLKGSETITLVKRESMGIRQVSQCLSELSEDHLSQVLYHMILRFCCAPTIGDSHLGNMLFNGKAVFGVDLEENRKNAEIKNVQTALDFVRLLFTKHQKAELLQPLATVLQNRKNHFIASLQNATLVLSHHVMRPITQTLPGANIHVPLMKERLSSCITLLSQF